MSDTRYYLLNNIPGQEPYRLEVERYYSTHQEASDAAHKWPNPRIITVAEERALPLLPEKKDIDSFDGYVIVYHPYSNDHDEQLPAYVLTDVGGRLFLTPFAAQKRIEKLNSVDKTRARIVPVSSSAAL